MPLVDQSTFIVELGKLLDNTRKAGSVYVSMKMLPPTQKVANDPSKLPVTEPRCILHANDGSSGKKKVAAADVPQFSKTFSVFIKSHADTLKKREKKKKVKSTKE